MSDYKRPSSKVVQFPEQKDYVRFYDDFVECDFCGQLTRGRVYEGSQKITCGACHTPFFEFHTEPGMITLELEDGETE
jgi:hypothetical protein